MTPYAKTAMEERPMRIYLLVAEDGVLGVYSTFTRARNAWMAEKGRGPNAAEEHSGVSVDRYEVDNNQSVGEIVYDQEIRNRRLG
jgi:hypothetical protein